mmetsp:Transcript_5774/g.11893  ORF Transcript_5774/g.11893 Transcript_5774/m.11893 type:complete len:116 (-) Transcript_5774:154-501(-)
MAVQDDETWVFLYSDPRRPNATSIETRRSTTVQAKFRKIILLALRKNCGDIYCFGLRSRSNERKQTCRKHVVLSATRIVCFVSFVLRTLNSYDLLLPSVKDFVSEVFSFVHKPEK